MQKYWIVEGKSLLEFKVVKTDEQTVKSEFYLVDGPFDTHEKAQAAINLIYKEMEERAADEQLAYEDCPNLGLGV